MAIRPQYSREVIGLSTGQMFVRIGSGATGWRRPRRFRRSHIAVAALDGLADHRRRDLVRDLDVPHFALALRGPDA